MRRLLGLFALFGVSLAGVSRLDAACGVPVPMYHGWDSYFVCPDGRPVYAFAYQLSDPTATNSGTAKIACEAFDTVEFGSSQGKGSGTVSWNMPSEYGIFGFNVVVYDGKGNRLQQNAALIPCKQCTTGLGDHYAFIIPKHKSGRNIFVEMVSQEGRTTTFGPAIKQ